jgi:hypothetical protein
MFNIIKVLQVLSEIWGFHFREYEDDCLLRSDVM